MKSIKLLATLTTGLTVVTPLVVMTSCSNKFKDNVVWTTKTKSTDEGVFDVTFTYKCKIVGDSDSISVKIASQKGIKLSIKSDTFDKATKTGTVIFKMDIQDEEEEGKTNFSVVVSSSKGNVWSNTISGLTAIYTPVVKKVPITALAYDTTTGDITGLKPTNADLSKCTKLFIPAKIDNVEIKGIASKAFQNVCSSSGTLKNVCEIEFDKNSTIATIKDYAFDGCSSLTKPITIPKTITGIWPFAFTGTKITSLTFEDGGTKELNLSNDCFKGTPIQGDLAIPLRTKEIGRDAFNGCTSLNGMLTLTPNTKLCNGVFQGCTAIGSLNLEAFTEAPSSDLWAKPEDSKKNGCFENICNSTKAIPLILQNYDTTFMTSVVDAIKAGSSTELAFKTAVTTSSIDFTYDNNDLITGFTLTPASTKTILYIPKWYRKNGVVTEIKGIAESAFYKDGASTIPSTITCLGFADNANFKTIGAKAFYEAKFTEQNTKIGGLYFPNSVTTIGASAFESASFGTISSSNKCSLYLPNKLTTLGNRAFKCAICLPESLLPESLTNVGAEAFSDCYLLDNTFKLSIALQDENAQVGNKAFAFGNSTILGHTTGPTIDFTNFWLQPKWTATSVFGSSSKIYDGNVTIKIKDMVVYNPDAYNAWDQYEYSQYFKTFMTTYGGLDEDKIEFDPLISKYQRSLFKTYQPQSSTSVYLSGFATYGNGVVIDSNYLKLFTKRETYLEEVNLIKIETLTPITKIADEALSYVEGEQCINFADNNIEAIEIPNTVDSIGRNFLSGQKNIKNIDMHTFAVDQYVSNLFAAETFNGLNTTDECVLWVGPTFTSTECEQLEFRLKNAYGLPDNWRVDRF